MYICMCMCICIYIYILLDFGARTTLRGVNWRSPGYMASVGFRHLNVYSHLVHDLDAAIDMHISLVRLRQGVCDQLIAGIDHYQALSGSGCMKLPGMGIQLP